MSERFLQLNIENEIDHEGDWLAVNHPNAFLLLYFIARRARRYNGHPDGLKVGMAKLGDWEKMGLSRQNYRTALKILTTYKFVEILETNRTRKKSTTGTTTEGTLVRLCDTRIWDINPESSNHRSNHCLTTDQPLTNHELRKIRKKRYKEKDHPSIPSVPKKRMTDDFSSKIEVYEGIFLTQVELDACLKIKGSIENVRDSIDFIQNSKRRKHEITDWPNALSRWKIENKAKTIIEDNLSYSEKLCKEFEDFKKGGGWRCYMYTDRKKDQRGVLFESESAYQQAFFIPLVDQELKNKADEFIKTKKMRRK